MQTVFLVLIKVKNSSNLQQTAYGAVINLKLKGLKIISNFIVFLQVLTTSFHQLLV
jgi:hypothetical protein